MKHWLVAGTLLLLTLLSCTHSDIFEIKELTVEYLDNPLGLDERNPRFAWKMTSNLRNKSQSAYQVLVASSPQLLDRDQGDLWDTGKTLSQANKQIAYQGLPLSSNRSYHWKVKVWDEHGELSECRDPGFWSTGLLAPGDWKAQWIAYDTEDYDPRDTLFLPAAPYFRRPFTLTGDIERATLFISALGLFEASVNGVQVGKDLFAPGWTDYHKRVYYKTYDVSGKLKAGENVLGVILGDGWYAGYIGPYSLGLPKNRELYGEKPALLCQLEIEYADGTQQTIISDENWKASAGPIVYADILMGTAYNANREMPEWNQTSYDDHSWGEVNIHPGTPGNIQAYPGDCIQVYEELATQEITPLQNGDYLFDLGQNFAGYARLTVSGNKNDTIVLRYGEMLHADGSLMTENLRFARATDTYVLKGEDTEVWEPQFTYHGFRYVTVSGLRSSPSKNMITGVAISSPAARNSYFSSSDSLLNQLYRNVVWTQRSNFLDVPTDCPQRDERLGWLGDAQIFSKSALYNSNLGAFYNKWMVDVRDAQYDFGPYANFAPRSYPKLVWYSPGWMEAGIMIPYNVYKFYGDTRIIENHYESMTRFMDFHIQKSEGKYFYPEHSWTDIGPKGGFGDWLSLTGQNLAHDILASIYLIHVSDLMAQMSEAIGKHDKAAYYRNIYEEGRANFLKHYLDETGRFTINKTAYGAGEGYFEGEKGFTGHTQSAYSSALYFDLLSSPEKEMAGTHLSQLLAEANGKPTSGILGIRQLLPGLAKVGKSDLAYEVLLNKEYPGWGFEIENGATTIWERWNSYTHEKGFNGAMNAKMNSFNHYAFGAVAEYLFSNMAGIDTEDPGYNQFIIRPDIGNRSVKQVRLEYESINGTIVSAWQIAGNEFTLDIEVPVNTTAKVYIPVSDASAITESGKLLSMYSEIGILKSGNQETVVLVGSGKYSFSSALASDDK